MQFKNNPQIRHPDSVKVLLYMMTMQEFVLVFPVNKIHSLVFLLSCMLFIKRTFCTKNTLTLLKSYMHKTRTKYIQQHVQQLDGYRYTFAGALVQFSCSTKWPTLTSRYKRNNIQHKSHSLSIPNPSFFFNISPLLVTVTLKAMQRCQNATARTKVIEMKTSPALKASSPGPVSRSEYLQSDCVL